MPKIRNGAKVINKDWTDWLTHSTKTIAWSFGFFKTEVTYWISEVPFSASGSHKLLNIKVN